MIRRSMYAIVRSGGKQLKVAAGDVYMLCTDGLWGSVPDVKIASILTANSDIEAACQLLVDAANEAGGPDNITVLLVRLG